MLDVSFLRETLKALWIILTEETLIIFKISDANNPLASLISVIMSPTYIDTIFVTISVN